MTTTFCEDSDITARDPYASAVLPTADSGSFNRLRVCAKAEILGHIRRRNPPVLETDLADTTELKNAEVYHVLRDLYFDAASRAGDNGGLYWEKYKVWAERALAEVESAQLSVGDEVSSVEGLSAPVWRS
jgi:hypothetical protein